MKTPHVFRLAGLLSFLLAPTVLTAQSTFTAISNLNQPLGTGGETDVTGTQSLGESFTTGSTSNSLAAVSVAIANISVGGNLPGQPASHLGAIAVALYSDANGKPGSSLAVLSGNNFPVNPGNYVYATPSALVLAPHTTYWVVATSSNSTGSGYYGWTATTLNSLNSGSIWTLGTNEVFHPSEGWNIDSGHLEFGVTVATNLPTVPLLASAPTASAIIQGQTLASSTLSGGTVTNSAGAIVPGSFAFTAPLTVPATGTAGELVTFTPTDPIDFYPVTITVPVPVVAGGTGAVFIASAPVAATISYGQTLASSTLSGGAATNAAGALVSGSFAFTIPATVPALGTNNELVTFIPTSTNVYVTFTNSVPVTVIPFTFMTNTPGAGSITITGYTNAGGTVVTIPDAINGLPVTDIGINAFYRTSVASVTLSTNVMSIGPSAFAGCANLTNITLPNGVTNIGHGAFNVCSKLSSFTFPTNLTTIEPGVFAECGALASVVIPDNVTSVGENAFDDCASLASVTIGSGVTNIAIQAFSGFNRLADITVDPNNPVFTSVGGVLFDKGFTTLLQFPGGWTGSYIVPDGISTIGYESFADCTRLTSVILPESVTNIEAYAFIFCTSLTSITIPSGVNTIPEYTFAEDSSLTNVTISGGGTGVGSQASSAVVPAGTGAVHANVSSLGSYVFSNCTGLSSIYFSGNAPAVDGTDFGSDNAATAYYLPGTTGWADFTAVTGIPAVPWNPQAQTSDGSFGVRAHQFGFNIAGGSNLVVVVMACTNLASPVWTPVSTNTLDTISGTNGVSYFSDPQSTNYPRRFYRFSFP